MKRALLILAAVLCMGASADPAERLPDADQEARARKIFPEVRCLVCQNQSIDDSEAPLAADLRKIIREQIVAGRTNAQIRTYLVDRYGEFVLFKPPMSPANAALWLTPIVLVLGGIGVWGVLVQRREQQAGQDAADEQVAAPGIAGVARAKEIVHLVPQSRAARLAVARWIAASEGFKHQRDLVRRDARAFIGHRPERMDAFARDLLNSDYAGHRLSFQLFAQSPPFAHLAAVYQNFDWEGPLEIGRAHV